MPREDGARLRADIEIEQDILTELRVQQDVADATLVGVDVAQGVVRLTGIVDSYAKKCAIERVAARVVGVRDVRDYLDVRPRDDDRREDRRIERAARRAIAWDARVPEGVRVDVTDGVLRLQGEVDRFSRRDAAEDAVRNLIGVRDIVNEIRLTSRPSTADLGPRVEAALWRRYGAECRHVWVAADDGAVTLRGIVSTFPMLDEIDQVVRAIPGVARIDNQLLVA